MSGADVDLIVTLVLLAFVLVVLWPAAIMYARRCNRRSEQNRRELDAAMRRWIEEQ